jgi:hypothetical protein
MQANTYIHTYIQYAGIHIYIHTYTHTALACIHKYKHMYTAAGLPEPPEAAVEPPSALHVPPAMHVAPAPMLRAHLAGEVAFDCELIPVCVRVCVLDEYGYVGV